MNRNLLLHFILLGSLLLASCGSGQSAPPPASTQSGPASNPPSSSLRQATVNEISNAVSVRADQNAEYIAAQSGMTLTIGGSVKTGDNSRARVDLLPDGTIVRVGPNSLYTVTALNMDQDGKPTTHIKLEFGQIWVLLKGGSLQVETPSGVASVRGSLLGVSYDPDAKKLQASCLEGHCALQDDQGEVELTDGQESTIEEDQPPSEPEQMSEEEIQQWVDENPDAQEFFDNSTPDWLPSPEPIEEMPTDEASPPDEAPTDDPPPDGG
ncbi:MAG: FecR domain-containing protein [Chloroflexi bacterium]|nr:FecR domain-containing protein [Chloroflexota bacterium]